MDSAREQNSELVRRVGPERPVRISPSNDQDFQNKTSQRVPQVRCLNLGLGVVSPLSRALCPANPSHQPRTSSDSTHPVGIRARHLQADKPLIILHLTTSTNMLYSACFYSRRRKELRPCLRNPPATNGTFLPVELFPAFVVADL
jgi:hypothetical protein